jgi:chromate transporter
MCIAVEKLKIIIKGFRMKENKKKLTQLFQIFTTFMKIGIFTFGGGYAMIPLIQRETVVKRKWVDDDDILDIVAIAESTPGPIAINASTFVGYRIGGFFGAVAGTVGMVLPSFIIILAISFVLNSFQDVQAVKYAFNGIRAGVLALIIRALWLMYKNVEKCAVSYIVMAAAFILSAFTSVNVIIVIVGCALFGLITAYINTKKK